MNRLLPLLTLLLIITSCKSSQKKSQEDTSSVPTPAATSLLGESLYAPPPSQKLLEKFQIHKANYKANPNADNLIWYGRFVAYQGKYAEAIAIYTEGITKFPKDARIYRHRGHRYISIRKFDEAINDFQQAAILIQGTENEVEPDGMPNAQNIPVSTLHGNIYYHLGLAYYLKHNFPNALTAYQKCLATSSNADNVVSSTHWLYMILRRMDKTEAAQKVLDKIEVNMPVIENMAYHKATLFYKGLISLEDVQPKLEAGSSANDALDYGIANWHLYNGEKTKAKKLLEAILKRKSWSSFGYIAAEKDYLIYFNGSK